MKQVFRELWVENRVVFVWVSKVVFLVLGGLSGILLRGFPYGIIWIFVLNTYGIMQLRLEGQINYMLPQTKEEMRARLIKKSAIVAVVYAGVNLFGYVLMIAVRGEYRFDLEMCLFLGYMTAVLFLHFFNLRFTICGNVYGQKKELLGAVQSGKRGVALKLGRDTAVILAGTMSCMVFLITKMGHVEFLHLLTFEWRVEAVIWGVVLCMFVRIVVRNMREMDFSEYWG